MRPLHSTAHSNQLIASTVVAAICILGPLAHAATPSVSVSQNTSSVGRYDVYELTMNNSASYANPWENVTITSIFTSPTGKTYMVGGFYYDVGIWKLRFAPMETGNWSWSLSYTDTSGTYHTTGGLSCTASSNRGWLRHHPSNPYRWICEGDGKPFYPIGFDANGLDVYTNFNWIDEGPSGRVLIDQYLTTYVNAGNNIYRHNWATVYQYILASGNTYLVPDSQDLDIEMQKLHQHGMKPYLVLWESIPSNLNMSNPADQQAVLRYYKYMIDRYGAYVDVWELMNENSSTQSFYDSVTQYFHAYDPYQHQISTSFPQPTLNLPLMDINSPHEYDGVDDASTGTDVPGIESVFANHISSWKAQIPNKPIIFGEVSASGPYNYNPLGYRLWTWTGFMNEAAPLFWNTNYSKTVPGGAQQYVGSEERSISLIFSNAIADFDAAARPISVNPNPASQMHAYALGSNQDICAYLTHASSFTTPLSGATLTLSVPANGMSGSWLDPATGNVLQTFTVNGGAQTISIPAFTIDIFLRIKGSGVGPTPPAIVTQPQNQTVTAPQTATFSIVASGTLPLSYQWQKNGSNIPGATSASYSTSATVTGDNGETFRCIVSNSAGSATSNSATLTVNTATPLTLAASPATVAPGGTITVTWSGASNTTATDWISIFSVGTPNSSYGEWHYTGGATSGTMSFTAPSTTGQYEIRYFFNDSYTILATSNTITVTAPAPTLSVSPTSVAPGGTVTVNWSGVSNATTQDSINLLPVGVADGVQLSVAWQYTTGAPSGALTYTIPAGTAAGQYEFRYYYNNSYTRLATSNSFTVVASDPGPLITSAASATPNPVSINGAVAFAVAANDADGDALTYSWNFGDGATGSGASTTHVYSSVGTYNAIVNVSDGHNKSATSNVAVVVNSATNLTITAAPTSVLPGASVTASWNGANPTAKDWIGVYAVGAPENSGGLTVEGVQWRYTGGTASGSLSLPAPSTPGQYEMRYYYNDGYTELAASNQFTVSSGVTSNVLGYQSIGGTTDSSCSNYASACRFTMPGENGTASVMSVYVAGPLGAAPNNKFQMAIYTDAGGKPGSLLASTASGTLTANSWNTLPITGSLTANSTYWLAYNTNGVNVSQNNVKYAAGTKGQYAWIVKAFGTWPATYGTPAGTYPAKVSINIQYQTTAAAPATSSALAAVVDTTNPSSAAAVPLKITRIQGSISFTSGGHDAVAIQGLIPNLPMFKPAGQTVTLNVGGAETSFTLDLQGNGKSGKSTPALRFNAGSATFTATLKGGNWASAWTKAGIANAEVSKAAISLPVTMLVNGNAYNETKSVLYSAHKNRTGAFK
jgi:hypothetical protein